MKKKLLCLILLAGWLSGLPGMEKANPEKSRKPAGDAAEDARHKLRPLGAPFSFTAAPGEKRVYRFSTRLLSDGESHAWKLTGPAEKESGISGRGTVKEHRLEVELDLPAGFYELRFPGLEQAFGISILPPHTGETDPFFAMEGLMEERSPEVYESCLNLLVRHGILHNREWTNFHVRNREEGIADDRNDRFYRAAGAKNVRSIFAIHDFPEWADGIFTGRRRSLPGKLTGVDTAIAKMLDSRKAGLEGFHILNEYDQISVPAEACLPPLKMAAWVARGRALTLAGAAFCKGSSVSERDSIAGGMLDFIDAFCIHTYSAPEEMAAYVRKYRNDMKKHPKAQMPIWVTESGKPWKRGLTGPVSQVYGGPLNNLRPQPEEDRISALWITMKAVEAKACGVARYYPFVMQFFQENNNNFGMLDYYGTPLRSMNAYAFASNLLSNLEYRGDWKRNPAGLLPTRVFSGGNRAAAVFYSGKNGTAERTVSLDGFPAGTGYAIDGSELHVKDNRLTFRGGMAYWVFPADKLRPPMLDTDTESMEMLRAAKSYRPVERRSTPLIYRYDFRRSNGEWRNSIGYILPTDRNLHFKVANLSGRQRTTRPRLTVPAGVTVTQPPPEKLELPPHSETDLTVGIAGSGGYHRIRLGDADDELSATAVPLIDLSHMKSETCDFMNPARWHRNSSGKQTFRFDEKEQAIEVRTDFRNKQNPAENNWSFPEFRFKPEEKKARLIAVSFEFRLDSRGAKKHPGSSLLMLSRNGEKYQAYPIDAPRNEWKQYRIVIGGSDNVPYDLLRIGMLSGEDDLAFSFRNIKLWY